jgi:hypothetical protein
VRKQPSKRRWKARADLGQLIPMEAIVNFRLDRWFVVLSAEESAWSQFYKLRRIR